MKEFDLTDTFWTGYCPECALESEHVRMRLNSNDFYECEKSQLQIAVYPGVHAIILKFKGEREFKNTQSFGDDIVNGEFLSPQTLDRPPFNDDGVIFNEVEEVIKYIQAIK